MMKHGLIASVLISAVVNSAFADDQNQDQVLEDIKAQVQEGMAAVPNAGPHFSMTGTLESGNGGFSVSGESFSLDKDAQVVGSLAAGRTAQVRGIIKDGQKIATEVVIRNAADEQPAEGATGDRPTTALR